jgi:hypothetical protein
MPITINGSTGIAGVDGSASTPAIQGTDTNTGIYFPGADRVGITEGGTQVAEFDASGNLKFNSGYGSVATAYGCRAWVNFNGNGTVAISASGNVSSVTDVGTGSYTINFSTALPDANYTSFGSCRPTAGGSPHYLFYVENKDNQSRTTSGLSIYYLNPTSQLAQDPEIASVSIVR